MKKSKAYDELLRSGFTPDQLKDEIIAIKATGIDADIYLCHASAGVHKIDS